MSSTELQRLMQAVLDGEATPEEAASLERQLASSGAARAEFEQLQRLFADLAAMPAKHPPEGLVASVTAALPAVGQDSHRGSQLPAASRVLAAAQGIHHLGGDGPVEEQHQLHPQPRRLPMTQPHPPYSAKRKAWIGAGIALVAVAIVVRYGFDSVPKAEDVAGTVVPAQRYRAPQAAPDIKLGDQSLAQLMQNDAFVKLIRDPQVQAMVREPAFAEAAQLMMREPELARALTKNGELEKRALNAESLRIMAENNEATRKIRYAAERAADLQASAEAQKLIKNSTELQKYVVFMADLYKKADSHSLERIEASQWLNYNAEQAQQFAAQAQAMEKGARSAELEKLAKSSAEVERFKLAHEEAAKVAKSYEAAAIAMARNADVMQVAVQNAALARVLFSNTEALRALYSSPAAAQLMVNHAAAAQAMLRAPDLSRHVLQNVDAARIAMQNEAERINK